MSVTFYLNRTALLLTSFISCNSCNDKKIDRIEQYDGYVAQVKMFSLYSYDDKFKKTIKLNPGESTYMRNVTKINEQGSQGKCGSKMYRIKFSGRVDGDYLTVIHVNEISELSGNYANIIKSNSGNISLSSVEFC
ncbi:hypothetical protein ACFSUK_16675 [Sphingobium scionense]|uniref:Uncharacterized protein n=1 Tax=Sphingobium scionense TaxID=1404341 RepID=A0A7W6LUW9_9SPHN|nr:hypothetical protein [Sphingobium scionense]MBB4150203.1 hypothetical protein [Sphingobium scionense]